MTAPGAVHAVVKIGGGLLQAPDALQEVLDTVADAVEEHALVIVPGGGPFADTVRAVDRAIGLPNDAAHWMAVLAMDQYAHLVCSRLSAGALVTTPAEIDAALRARTLPVLAPARWLREADPLPHSWDVTSDSIAAWVTEALGARQLMLIKPAGAGGAHAVDAYFTRAVQRGTRYAILPADRIASLRAALREAREPAPGR